MFPLRFTHDYSYDLLTILESADVLFKVLYNKHKGLKKDTLLTKTHENSRFLTNEDIATILLDHKDSRGTSTDVYSNVPF